MKVRCINTGGEVLRTVDIAAGNTRLSVFHVTVGREYAVYGVLLIDAVLHYLIEEDTGLPIWNPASLFQIVCGHVSRSWVIADWSPANSYFVVMSFPEFVESQKAFDELSLGDEVARSAFFKRKELADLEFLDLSVEKAALPVEGNWLQCPFCGDAWQSTGLDAMARCPACQRISRNPNYQTE